ncbi:MAG TPA: hypothetical protein VF600_15630 [Abditibacteriaceae bacterium]
MPKSVAHTAQRGGRTRWTAARLRVLAKSTTPATLANGGRCW